MGGIKEIEEKKDEGVAVSRRTFMKGAGALTAAAALYGCGGDGDGPSAQFDDSISPPAVPQVTGEVVAGAAPHNCGGRCVTKAYVEDGVVKRLVTDERPDKNIIDNTGDSPQFRACVRCRSHKGVLYRADRLNKPLKQTGARGDINGFVEISWDQAFSEIAQELNRIKGQYGPAALFNHYASGDGGSVPNAAECANRLLNLLGGSQQFRSDYSWPSIEHTSWFVLGQDNYFPLTNCRQDVMNAEQVVLWCWNGAEAIWGTNTMWYLQQARERGVHVTAIDARVSKTAATITNDVISPVQGTDAAMVLGMMHHLLTHRLNDLDIPFIKSHVHGFFDDPKPTLHQPGVDDTKYIVPAGTSLSAFVMGNDVALVTAGINQGTSVYPETIGYNNVSGPGDPLFGKRAPIWGQEPKTPEWAEKITGVPAARIRALADAILDKKTHIWYGGGWQRHSEGEQGPWSVYILGGITKCFGQPGQMFGIYGDKVYAGNLGFPVGANGVDLSSDLYDTSKLTAPNNTPFITRGTWPVFLWSDVMKNGGTGNSDWNDGQVKRMPVGIKALMNFGGNILGNQTGDLDYVEQIVKDRSKCELIVVADSFMTGSAALADYVLPAALAYEKIQGTTTWVVGESLLHMGKAVEPLGECKSDYQIVAGIAEQLGLGGAFTEGKTDEDWVREAWETNKAQMGITMTYEEWKEVGVYSSSNPAAPNVVKWEGFFANPAANPLLTPSGKFEAYAQAMVEDYEARGYNNIDPDATLVNGVLHDGSNAGRFVYPIPMYIPLIEGRHADENAIPHPDVLGLRDKGYELMLGTWHIQYRSHSTLNNNAFMNERYKKDAQGNPAFLDPHRTTRQVWDDGVYEEAWINPSTAGNQGVTDGDRVLISNTRAKVYAVIHVSQTIPPFSVFLGQGSWRKMENGIDVGGCANTLTAARPTRICQGMTLAGGTLVKIQKA